VIAEVASGLPTHEAFIARHCQAPLLPACSTR